MSMLQLLLYGVGALGTLPRGFAKWLVVLEKENLVDLLQRTCLLGTAHVMGRTELKT